MSQLLRRLLVPIFSSILIYYYLHAGPASTSLISSVLSKQIPWTAVRQNSLSESDLEWGFGPGDEVLQEWDDLDALGWNQDRSVFRRRIVAIGDIHGDLPHFLRILSSASLITSTASPDASSATWSGGKTIFVQTGDIVDRGTDTIRLYQLLDRLQGLARDQGGEVRRLLGNHEYMNAMGDWRYVTKEDIATFGSAENRRKAMSYTGWIGRTWLNNCSVATRVPYSPMTLSDAASSFVHGGIHPSWASRDPKTPVEYINQVGHGLLRKVSGAGEGEEISREEHEIYGENGPLWYRGYAYETREDVICPLAEEAARLLGVRRLVMGHTPFLDGIKSRCDGTIILIDTGISRAYGGALSHLEILYSLTRDPSVGPETMAKWTEREILVAHHLGAEGGGGDEKEVLVDDVREIEGQMGASLLRASEELDDGVDT